MNSRFKYHFGMIFTRFMPNNFCLGYAITRVTHLQMYSVVCIHIPFEVWVCIHIPFEVWGKIDIGTMFVLVRCHWISHFQPLSAGTDSCLETLIGRPSNSFNASTSHPVLSNAVASQPTVASLCASCSGWFIEHHSCNIWRTISKAFVRWLIRICLILLKVIPSSNPRWRYSDEILSATAFSISGYTPWSLYKELSVSAEKRKELRKIIFFTVW